MNNLKNILILYYVIRRVFCYFYLYLLHSYKISSNNYNSNEYYSIEMEKVIDDPKLLKLKQLKESNLTSKHCATINQRYTRSIKYKEQYLKERHKLSYVLEQARSSKLIIDKRLLINLETCKAKVPESKGQKAIFAKSRECQLQVMFPGYERCFLHNNNFLSKAIERGSYKEIIRDGNIICDPKHYVQVKWIEGKGYSLFVPHGQKGDLVSWMDGPYLPRRDCTPSYM